MEMTKQKANPFTRAWKNLWREPGFAILTIILALAILLLIVLPVMAVLLKSFGIGSETLTFSHYKDFLSSSTYLEGLRNSILSSIVTTIVVIFLSIIVGLYVTRSRSLLSRFYGGVALLPLVTPPFIFSLSLIILLGRNGIITNLFSDWFGWDFSIYGFWGVVLSQIIGYFPMGYMLVENTLRSMDPSLEHASRDLGSSQWRTLRKVTLPLAKSGIIKAAMLVFVMAMADFSNPLIIGGGDSFLSSEMYLAVVGQHNMELAAVMGVFLIIPSLIIFIFQTYFLKDTNLETISGGSGESNAPLTKSVKGIMGTISTLFTLIIIGMFVMVVLGAFVKIIGINNSFTLDHFKDQSNWEPLYTSFIVSLISAVLAAVIGILQGYLFARKPIPGKSVLEFLTLFGLAVPGTVMGIGYVLIFNGPPFFLTGSVTLLILNMTFRKIGVGMENSVSKMHQIDSSMEEASKDLGAGPYRTFLRVVAPLLTPSFVVGFVYTFMTAMVSISSVVFLISPGTNLVAVQILNLAEQAKVGMASAMSFILIVIVLFCMGLLKFLEKRLGAKI